VHQSQLDPDPLFDAPLTPLARPDTPRALAAVSRRVGGNLAAWDAQQRPDLDRFEALLLQCGRIPCSTEERSRVDRRLDDTPIAMRLDEKGDMQLSSPALAVGGLAESLIMAYADGLDFPGWQGIDARSIGKALAIHGAGIDLRTRTHEVARQSSTYLAVRLLATLLRVTENPALADPIGGGEKIIVLSGHDGTLTMLAGLLGLNWHLPGYAPGEAAPGGALLFELWRRKSDGQRSVRIHYVAQTLDQMRFLVPLSLERPPSSVAVPLPGCGDAEQGCGLDAFTAHVLRRVSPR
jgi:4-phytase/acid phosphatase